MTRLFNNLAAVDYQSYNQYMIEGVDFQFQRHKVNLKRIALYDMSSSELLVSCDCKVLYGMPAKQFPEPGAICPAFLIMD